jgi:hypothetical protein
MTTAATAATASARAPVDPDLAKRAIYARLRRWKADPWAFVAEGVWTLDEAHPGEKIRRFPIATCGACQRYASGDEWAAGACQGCHGPLRELAYLRLLAERWADRTAAPILLIPKPRRMRLSWLMMALHTWRFLFYPGSKVFILSSKEGKSKELIDRAEFILARLVSHAGMPADALPVWTRQQAPPSLTIPKGLSQMVGLPEGPDQLRQFTATAIFADEIGTWTWPRASWGGMIPCIEGGGQIAVVSSAFPGFWRQLVSGELTA